MKRDLRSVASHSYKTAGNLDLMLDVYRSPHSTDRAPALIWIHGGALIQGGRDGLSHLQHEIEMYYEEGITLISIDYRLAPETKLPEIVTDIRDALNWVRDNAEELRIDPKRVGVVGHSAGGYLSLMAGTFEAPPTAVVSFYGYGDIVGDWLSEPSAFYRETADLVDEATAREHYRGSPVANAGERPETGLFYLFCRQQGIWPQEVGGVDPTDDLGFFVTYCPEQNVTTGYPPTILLHGQKDTDVPFERSVQMAEALKASGVEHELVLLEKGHHGFDFNPEKTPGCETAFGKVRRFLREHL